MLHFPYFFQIHDISKVSKGVIIKYRVNALDKCKHGGGINGYKLFEILCFYHSALCR